MAFYPGATTYPGSTTYPGNNSFVPVGVFRGVLCQRWVPIAPPVAALMNYSKAVLRIAGQWVEAEFPAEQQIDAADLYFPGGYETEVDQSTKDLLTAAGYTVDPLP